MNWLGLPQSALAFIFIDGEVVPLSKSVYIRISKIKWSLLGLQLDRPVWPTGLWTARISCQHTSTSDVPGWIQKSMVVDAQGASGRWLAAGVHGRMTGRRTQGACPSDVWSSSVCFRKKAGRKGMVHRDCRWCWQWAQGYIVPCTTVSQNKNFHKHLEILY